MASFADRMIRAARLDANVYEEVEADREALSQAMTVVALSSLAAGIGSIGQLGVRGMLFTTVVALLGWLVWAYLTYLIGTRLLPGARTEATLGQLLRTIGFSSSPGLLQVLGVLSILGEIVSLVAALWMLVAMIVAVRQALDYESTTRAVGVCVVGWVVQFIFLGLAVSLFGPPPAK